MKRIYFTLATIAGLFTLSSCEFDEGILPDIEFKTGSGYLYEDTTLESGASFKTGIRAEKTENRDVLKKFNISTSVNGGATTSIYNRDLNDSEEDYFSYDYNGTVQADSGDVVLYIFTVSNRDGLVNQVDFEITVD
ncbi:MAG: hypothetical protein HWD92_05825 [Flavobacteriia bacterium]|nr:hypothetical protein [Flavobacteriia bacterium]